MSRYQEEEYSESSTYDSYGGGRGGGRRGYEDETFTETETSDRYGGGPRRGYNDQETFTETETYQSDGYGRGGGLPPPPNVPWPWRPRWDERSRQYFFVHEQTQETVWSVEEVQMRVRESGGGGGGRRGDYYESENIQESEYSSRGAGYGGGGGRGYGGSEQVYESEEVVDERSTRGGGGGGHGLAYGAMGAIGGLAAGAFAMYEGEKIHNDYEQDKYRVEGDVDRFGDDVADAPENIAGWVGDKVGDVERFGDNVDNAYDDGRDDGRYGNDY